MTDLEKVKAEINQRLNDKKSLGKIRHSFAAAELVERTISRTSFLHRLHGFKGIYKF